jgi:hypothetical protein
MDQAKGQHKETDCTKEVPAKEKGICNEHNKDKALCADQHQAKPGIVTPQPKK